MAAAWGVKIGTGKSVLVTHQVDMVRRIPKRKVRAGVDEYGRTPLHYACNERNEALCAELLGAGAPPNALDDNGWTPLHFAAQAQSVSITSLLLNAGAEADIRDSDGNTPLWRATITSRGQGDVIRRLRAAGADPYAKNNAGRSPIDVARTIVNHPIAQFYSDLPAEL
jgi:ankyrin repeat protein